MPIVDVELVCASEAEFNRVSAHTIADALGHVFATPPGRTWVRLHFLSSSAYAENQTVVQSHELPIFVTILHAHPPIDAALATEALACTMAVAKCAARPVDRVHVQYSRAAAGRQAFGGTIVQ